MDYQFVDSDWMGRLLGVLVGVGGHTTLASYAGSAERIQVCELKRLVLNDVMGLRKYAFVNYRTFASYSRESLPQRRRRGF